MKNIRALALLLVAATSPISAFADEINSCGLEIYRIGDRRKTQALKKIGLENFPVDTKSVNKVYRNFDKVTPPTALEKVEKDATLFRAIGTRAKVEREAEIASGASRARDLPIARVSNGTTDRKLPHDDYVPNLVRGWQGKFKRVEGPFVDIPNGTVVEGSVKRGGLQPDYVMDFGSPPFDKLRAYAKKVGSSDEPLVNKVENLKTYVGRYVLKEGSYSDPEYRALMRKYREEGRLIPTSAYAECKAGTCRENGMILHMALKEAGIPNEYVYAKVRQTTYYGDGSIYSNRLEDHGFVVVKENKNRWLIDSYNSNFHGYDFDQLTDPKLTKDTPLRRWKGKPDNSVFRSVEEVNNYPTLWVPKDKKTAEAVIARAQNSTVDRVSDFKPRVQYGDGKAASGKTIAVFTGEVNPPRVSQIENVRKLQREMGFDEVYFVTSRDPHHQEMSKLAFSQIPQARFPNEKLSASLRGKDRFGAVEHFAQLNPNSTVVNIASDGTGLKKFQAENIQYAFIVGNENDSQMIDAATKARGIGDRTYITTAAKIDSAYEVNDALRAGKATNDIPANVAAYIEKNKLYRAEEIGERKLASIPATNRSVSNVEVLSHPVAVNSNFQRVAFSRTADGITEFVNPTPGAKAAPRMSDYREAQGLYDFLGMRMRAQGEVGEFWASGPGMGTLERKIDEWNRVARKENELRTIYSNDISNDSRYFPKDLVVHNREISKAFEDLAEAAPDNRKSVVFPSWEATRLRIAASNEVVGLLAKTPEGVSAQAIRESALVPSAQRKLLKSLSEALHVPGNQEKELYTLEDFMKKALPGERESLRTAYGKLVSASEDDPATLRRLDEFYKKHAGLIDEPVSQEKIASITKEIRAKKDAIDFYRYTGKAEPVPDMAKSLRDLSARDIEELWIPKRQAEAQLSAYSMSGALLHDLKVNAALPPERAPQIDNALRALSLPGTRYMDLNEGARSDLYTLAVVTRREIGPVAAADRADVVLKDFEHMALTKNGNAIRVTDDVQLKTAVSEGIKEADKFPWSNSVSEASREVNTKREIAFVEAFQKSAEESGREDIKALARPLSQTCVAGANCGEVSSTALAQAERNRFNPRISNSTVERLDQRAVRTTQYAVGEAQVDEVLEKLGRHSDSFKDLQKAARDMAKRELPGAVGPDLWGKAGNQTYIFDGHHLTMELYTLRHGDYEDLPKSIRNVMSREQQKILAEDRELDLRVKVQKKYSSLDELVRDFAKSDKGMLPEKEARKPEVASAFANARAGKKLTAEEVAVLGDAYKTMAPDLTKLKDDPVRAALGKAFDSAGLAENMKNYSQIEFARGPMEKEIKALKITRENANSKEIQKALKEIMFDDPEGVKSLRSLAKKGEDENGISYAVLNDKAIQDALVERHGKSAKRELASMSLSEDISRTIDEKFNLGVQPSLRGKASIPHREESDLSLRAAAKLWEGRRPDDKFRSLVQRVADSGKFPPETNSEVKAIRDRMKVIRFLCDAVCDDDTKIKTLDKTAVLMGRLTDAGKFGKPKEIREAAENLLEQMSRKNLKEIDQEVRDMRAMGQNDLQKSLNKEADNIRELLKEKSLDEKQFHDVRKAFGRLQVVSLMDALKAEEKSQKEAQSYQFIRKLYDGLGATHDEIVEADFSGKHVPIAFTKEQRSDMNKILSYYGTGRASNSTVERAPASILSLTKGQDEAERMLKLGEALRERNIDPRHTHIPEFASEAKGLVQFARSSLNEQEPGAWNKVKSVLLFSKNERDSRLQLLKEFEKEANDRVARKKVTYEWWNDFNYRTAILMTPPGKRITSNGGADFPFQKQLINSGAWKTNEAFRNAADTYSRTSLGFRESGAHDVARTFPHSVSIPTREGDLGLSSLNSMYGKNIHPVGVLGKRVDVDGREMFPDHFYIHDHGHGEAERRAQSFQRISPAQFQNLRDTYLAFRQTLNEEDRHAFEFGYFFLTHESSQVEDLYNGKTSLNYSGMIVGVRSPNYFGPSVPRWAMESDSAAEKFLISADKQISLFHEALVNPDPSRSFARAGAYSLPDADRGSLAAAKKFPEMFKGGEDVDRMLGVAERLRSEKINPKSTHIPEFAADAPKLMKMAESAISEGDQSGLLNRMKRAVTFSPSDRVERERILNRFKLEAEDRINSKSVTYEWWNDFNYRTAILMTPEQGRTVVSGGAVDPFAKYVKTNGSWKTNEDFRKAADLFYERNSDDISRRGSDGRQFAISADFPDRVSIPTMAGDIGIARMNELAGTDVNPKGLISRKLRADGREMYPDHFYRHDEVHAANEDLVRRRYDLNNGETAKIRENYLSYRETLNPDRRAAFEFGYFIATHELPYLSSDLFTGRGTNLANRKGFAEYLQNPDWFKDILPRHATVDSESAQAYLREVDKEMAAFSYKVAGMEPPVPYSQPRGQPVYSQASLKALQLKNPPAAAAARYYDSAVRELADARHDYFSGKISFQELEKVNATYGHLETRVTGNGERERRLGYFRQEENYLTREIEIAKAEKDFDRAAVLENEHAAVSAKLIAESDARVSLLKEARKKQGGLSRSSIESITGDENFARYSEHFPGKTFQEVSRNPSDSRLFRALQAKDFALDEKVARESREALSRAFQKKVVESGDLARAEKLSSDLVSVHTAFATKEIKQSRDNLLRELSNRGWTKRETDNCVISRICAPGLELSATRSLKEDVSPLARSIVMDSKMSAFSYNPEMMKDARALYREPPKSIRGGRSLDDTFEALQDNRKALAKEAKSLEKNADRATALREVKEAQSAIEYKIEKFNEVKGSLKEKELAVWQDNELDNLATKATISYFQSTESKVLEKIHPELKSASMKGISDPEKVLDKLQDVRAAVKALSTEDRAKLVAEVSKFAATNAEAKLANGLTKETDRVAVQLAINNANTMAAALPFSDPSAVKGALKTGSLNPAERAITNTLGATAVTKKGSFEREALNVKKAREIEKEMKSVSRAPASAPTESIAKLAKRELASVKMIDDGLREDLVKSVAAMEKNKPNAITALEHLKTLAAGNPDVFETFRMAYVNAGMEARKGATREDAWKRGVEKMLRDSGYSKAEIRDGLLERTLACLKI